MVDPDKEPALAEQMKITTAPSVHLQYGKERFVVTQPDRGDDHQRHHPRHAAATKKIVYFTEGYGEAGIEDAAGPKGYVGREARPSSRRTTR